MSSHKKKHDKSKTTATSPDRDQRPDSPTSLESVSPVPVSTISLSSATSSHQRGTRGGLSPYSSGTGLPRMSSTQAGPPNQAQQQSLQWPTMNILNSLMRGTAPPAASSSASPHSPQTPAPTQHPTNTPTKSPTPSSTSTPSKSSRRRNRRKLAQQHRVNQTAQQQINPVDDVSIRQTIVPIPRTPSPPTLQRPQGSLESNIGQVEPVADFVLVWRPVDNPEVEMHLKFRRDHFERKLISEGCKMEEYYIDGLMFINVHATWPFLSRNAELLRLRVPIEGGVQKQRLTVPPRLTERIRRFLNLRMDRQVFPKLSNPLMATYRRERSFLFEEPSEDFFTPMQRSMIVSHVMERTPFLPDGWNPNAYGIGRMLQHELYVAAYPLHDGEIHELGTMRNRLYDHWARIRLWWRPQPLDYVRRYMGSHVGIYFAWVEFHTALLVLAAIAGFVPFSVGIAKVAWGNSDPVIGETCNGRLQLCPACDQYCEFRRLDEECPYVYISYLMDNDGTLFYVVFMSLWTNVYLKLWLRYSFELAFQWNMITFSSLEEPARPRYVAHVKGLADRDMQSGPGVDTDAAQAEAEMPSFWKARVISTSVVLLVMVLISAALGAIMVFTLAAQTASRMYGTQAWAMPLITVTASTLTLVMVMAFDRLYIKIALWLTEREVPRTQTEFDNSFTLKMYALQFVNNYASVFYVSFVRSAILGPPGDLARVFGQRFDNCSIFGCMPQVSQQMVVIMVGKQLFSKLVQHLIMPKLCASWKRWRRSPRPFGLDELSPVQRRMEADLALEPWDQTTLFNVYLEMVIQFGFVTIFAAAFPFAPLFAVINNVLDTRMDAKNFLRNYRRPVEKPMKNIGVWLTVMMTVAKISVLTNAFTVAFTSEFIPRYVYWLFDSPDGTMKGYVASILTQANVTDMRTMPTNLTYCFYAEQWAASNLPRVQSERYWQLVAFRLLFVVLFMALAAFVWVVLDWLLTKKSRLQMKQMKHEAHLVNESIIEHEQKFFGTTDQHKERYHRVSYEDAPDVEDPEKLMANVKKNQSKWKAFRKKTFHNRK